MTAAGSRFTVSTRLPQYQAALAQLTVSARLADDMRGAVAVVPGGGDWWRGLWAARAGGAAAVVLADPGMLPPGATEGSLGPADIPVIVDRPGLRADVVADALQARGSSPPRMLTIDCAAPAEGMQRIIRDAAGWARSLMEGALELGSGASTAGATMALLEGRRVDGAATPVTLMATPAGGRRPGGLIRVVAHGEVRTEVTIDQPAGLVRVETSTEAGMFLSPTRYEASARLALRRAIAACASGEPAGDLAELLADMAVVADLAGV